MKAVTKLILFNEDNDKFFGEGPFQLLKKVEETGSLHAAAQTLGMAYSKATKLVKNAEHSLGYPLTVRKIGGQSGGGSVLTEEAKDFMKRYESYRDACRRHNEQLFEQYFGEERESEMALGCVIMASGKGKRFGGDKLMTEMSGKPIIQYIIEVTDGLFAERVVVTRNELVRDWCEERHIPVVYHELPNRNDTIRLGLQALEAKADKGVLSGCVFCPADMPLVTRKSLQEMVTSASKKKKGIFRMAYEDQVGSPVLFMKEYFERLKHLPAGKGGSEIIRDNPDAVHCIEVPDERELWDIDTREDYDRVLGVIK